MSAEHHVHRDAIHHDWNRSLEPVLTIDSGDIVHFDLRKAGDGQVFEDSTAGAAAWDVNTLYNLAGPIAVRGAKPGHTLEVEFVALQPGPWGWTATIPELGLLPDDFPGAHLKIWDLRDGTSAELVPGVRVPLRPFLGTAGVAPAQDGVLSPFPPHAGGGNIDNRHLVEGSRLWLPILNEGALFSCGDAHGAQGDGEVCVSAIECDMHATLRLTVRDHPLDAPSYHVPAAAQAAPVAYHGTMGIDTDLYTGAQKAVRAMVAWIVEAHALDPADAFVLASVAGDLHIHEIVDAGVWNVGMTLPLNVFV